MSQPFRPFSEIPFATSLPASTDTVVGVINKTTDTRFTISQLQKVIGGGGGGGGGGTVTEIDTGTGLVGGPITGQGTILLANTAVTPGTYTNSTIAVDAQGRLTFAASGTLSTLALGATGVTGGAGNNLLYEHLGVLQEATIGSGLTFSGGTLTATASSGTDPLFLTQGLSVSTTDPSWGGDATFRRAAEVTATFDAINSAIGFTDQVALSVGLEFDAGYNQYGGSEGNIDGKYTPIALDVGATYYGAGEKFLQTWQGSMWSMGDSFMFSAQLSYTGGPINGDEGQGFTSQEFVCSQPGNTFTDTINGVIRTTYSTTVTGNVAGSYIAQAIPVASTVGANVDDWVILNQEVMSAGTRIWAMKIESIQAGVSITGVCAINLFIGDTVKPALCLNLIGAGQGFGEGRVVVNYSGASYSTGLVGSVSGGSFIGSGTTWTNTMVGGDALNVGSVWLTVDDLTSFPFSVGTPLHSVYQITRVNSTTGINIFSFSVAADIGYNGRGAPPATNLAYTIVPSARIMRHEPQGSGRHTIICEYSAHTWTNGDTVECVICPYPDVHGFNFGLGEFTAGGVRRYFMGLTNVGARTINTGFSLGPGGGFNSNPDFDVFAFGTGIFIGGAQTGIAISRSEATVLDAIQINSQADAGTIISTASSATTLTIGINSANVGYDFINPQQGSTLGTVAASVNPDGSQTQLVWNGYMQIAPQVGVGAKLRFGGSNLGGASTSGTADINWNNAAIQFLTDAGRTSSNLTLEVNSSSVKFGIYNIGAGATDLRVALDASNLTAARTAKFPDTGGDILVAAANTTGSGTPLFGTNSPAVTNAAPYTWLQMKSHDGSTVYVPAWK